MNTYVMLCHCVKCFPLCVEKKMCARDVNVLSFYHQHCIGIRQWQVNWVGAWIWKERKLTPDNIVASIPHNGNSHRSLNRSDIRFRICNATALDHYIIVIIAIHQRLWTLLSVPGWCKNDTQIQCPIPIFTWLKHNCHTCENIRNAGYY